MLTLTVFSFMSPPISACIVLYECSFLYVHLCIEMGLFYNCNDCTHAHYGQARHVDDACECLELIQSSEKVTTLNGFYNLRIKKMSTY